MTCLLYARVLDQFKAEVRKIATQKFIQALTKKVLVTRSATQAGLERGNHPSRGASRYQS